MKKVEMDAKNREYQDTIVGRKEKRLNEVKDYIKNYVVWQRHGPKKLSSGFAGYFGIADRRIAQRSVHIPKAYSIPIL
jgi:hypothetical protein